MLVLLPVACGILLPQKATLLPDPASAPPAIREACALAEQKCTRCHTLGRVLSFRTNDWGQVVARMRRQTASTITDADEPVILTCLEYRSSQP